MALLQTTLSLNMRRHNALGSYVRMCGGQGFIDVHLFSSAYVTLLSTTGYKAQKYSSRIHMVYLAEQQQNKLTQLPVSANVGVLFTIDILSQACEKLRNPVRALQILCSIFPFSTFFAPLSFFPDFFPNFFPDFFSTFFSTFSRVFSRVFSRLSSRLFPRLFLSLFIPLC